MNTEHERPLDGRMRRAVEELQGVISARYPGATFDIVRDPEEPENVDLLTTVDLEDPDEVLDLVIDRLVDLQAEERVPLHVIPVRTPARILADLPPHPRPMHRLHHPVSSLAGPATRQTR